jgi:Ca2+-binding RTX toxin-like protein
LRGNDQDNVLRGNAGYNELRGGAGDDTARFTGLAREYRIQPDGSDLVVTDSVQRRDGVDRLVSIEWLEFADGRRSAAELAGE